MPSVSFNTKSAVRSKRRAKAKPMTNVEILQKMMADQKFIREAIQSGVTFEELEQKSGFKFARLPHIPNK